MRKRRGTKKIDKVEVTGPEGRMMVDIYLNTDTSEFQAELFGDSFHNEDLNALTAGYWAGERRRTRNIRGL